MSTQMSAHMPNRGLADISIFSEKNLKKNVKLPLITMNAFVTGIHPTVVVTAGLAESILRW